MNRVEDLARLQEDVRFSAAGSSIVHEPEGGFAGGPFMPPKTVHDLRRLRAYLIHYKKLLPEQTIELWISRASWNSLVDEIQGDGGSPVRLMILFMGMKLIPADQFLEDQYDIRIARMRN